MTTIAVFHAIKPTFVDFLPLPPLCEFKPVALFECEEDKMDKVYEWTQNIDESWNPKEPSRSTSVGDLFLVSREDGTLQWYQVASIGFTQVNPE